jgi:hypothetical protein
MMSMGRYLFFILLLCSASVGVFSQDSILRRCGTVERLEEKFNRNPSLRSRFEKQRLEFNNLVYAQRASGLRLEGGIYYIPVVFHIVLNNPAIVTDAQVQAQLDTLNKAFAGTNGDSVKIPDYFKALAGKSAIRFCLAQRTPQGAPTTGIHRVSTTRSSFSNTTEGVKYSSTGGTDGWNNQQYLNVWICVLSNGILGYSSFPDDGTPQEQGVAIDYRTLPGGSFSSYNAGKTLAHETGHFFNLYHIWGDDNGACTGTDYVDDTPAQANSTTTCLSGVRYDNCTRTGNGIMYQNYMDYSTDACLVMFTSQQVQRMQAALTTYFASLGASDACQPVSLYEYNAELTSIFYPGQRLCTNSFSPVITFKNLGSKALTSLVITTAINNVQVQSYQWTGLLEYYGEQTITLPSITVEPGIYPVLIRVSRPNNLEDEVPGDDALSVVTQFYPAVATLAESFETAQFPPLGWDIVNTDNENTWEKTNGAAAAGSNAVVMKNYGTTMLSGDFLRTPELNLSQVDSAYLTFRIAATSASTSAMRTALPDTFSVLLSQDCGITYTSLYNKSGSGLSTTNYQSTDAYTPLQSEWRKDSVNLTGYIGKGDFMIAFRNGSGGQNNIYLDDIQLRKVIINPNLKEKGILITPNPAKSSITIQFYPPPVGLRSITLYTLAGQKIMEQQVNNSSANLYVMDIGGHPAGTYVVVLRFQDKIIQRKIIKIN